MEFVSNNFFPIAKRQQKKAQENNETAINTSNAGFVTSPARIKPDVKNTPRRSTRKHSLSASVNKNSPGLKMLRASMSVKQIAEGVGIIIIILKIV